MTRSFFPVWCKGSTGDLLSSGAGSNPAAGSINHHNHTPHTPRITALTATLAILAIILLPTQTASAEGLPDGRVDEMVTPAENQEADVYVPYAVGSESISEGVVTPVPFQAAVDGSAITYPADPTSPGLGLGGRVLGNQYIARRSAGGWTQNLIQPAARKRTYYQGFAEDLSTGILNAGEPLEASVPPLSSEAPGGGYPVLYARSISESALSGSENPYHSLFTTKPSFRTAGSFGVNEVYAAGKAEGVPVFAGGSVAGGLVFEANDDLLPGGGVLERELAEDVSGEVKAGQDQNYVYSSVGGKLSLLDVLPDGRVESNATVGSGPFNEPSFNAPAFGGAVGVDGRYVYWSALSSGIVYVRVGGVSTLQVSAGSARYWDSGDDGRYAFYSEGEELYRFDAQSDTREVLAGPGSGTVGVIGASEDGSSVYFVARGVLGSAAVGAQAGEPNLYLLQHGGVPVFIATLSGGDGYAAEPFASISQFGAEYGDWQPGLAHRSARVVGSGGGSVVFMSNRSPAVVGFPHGFPSGGLDEVYLFQADSGKLFCVSCSPSGEAPHASVAGAAGFLPIGWSDTYLPQWVSEDGNRVFFDSGVPLVAEDTNGRQDVYEWEREGTGSCTEGAGTNGGCVFLLSGGTSAYSSWFVGASASGDDAFIVTRAQLAPEDHNEAFDLYDARVGGQRPVSPPACTGAGCQGVPAPPPSFSTPASVTFSGVGNFPPPAAPASGVKPTPKAKAGKCRSGFVKKHSKCVKGKTNRKTKRSTKVGRGRRIK